MGYADYLWHMLSPLGVYQRDGYGGGELTALGCGMDAAEAYISDCRGDMLLQTAGVRGISLLESLFPMVQKGSDLEARRNALMVLFGVQSASCTREGILAQLEACGVSAELTELEELGLKVTLTETLTLEDDPEFLMWLLETILPCHLSVTCECRYPAINGMTIFEEESLAVLRKRTRAEWEEKITEWA